MSVADQSQPRVQPTRKAPNVTTVTVPQQQVINVMSAKVKRNAQLKKRFQMAAQSLKRAMSAAQSLKRAKSAAQSSRKRAKSVVRVQPTAQQRAMTPIEKEEIKRKVLCADSVHDLFGIAGIGNFMKYGACGSIWGYMAELVRFGTLDQIQ